MVDGVRLYVGSHKGLLVYSLRGDECRLAVEAFPGAIIDSAASCSQCPERVFVGVTHDGVYRTDDAGEHWRKVLEGDIRWTHVDPADDRVIYAGTEPVHLYRSEDGGDSWQELTSLQRLPEQTFGKLGIRPSEEREDNRDPTYKHIPQHWTFPRPPHQAHITQMFIHPQDSNLLFLSIEHGGIARSIDRGETWEDVSGGIDYLDIHAVAGESARFDRYFVASARGFYRTADPAAGWTRAEHGCTRSYFHDFMFLESPPGAPATMIVATADGSPGHWPAAAGKDYWDRSQTGARTALFRSNDGAESWHRIGVGDVLAQEMNPFIWSLAHHPGDSQAVFAGIGEVSAGHAYGDCGSGAVALSTDRGDTWHTVQDGIPAVRHLIVTTE